MSVSKKIELHGGVLVAHDGSVPAEAALRTAVRVAAGLGKPVTVVRAWTISTAPRPETAAPGYMPPFEDFEAATLAALEKDVARVRADNPDVPITAAVVHGSAAERIVEASDQADLVVVGSRGRGGFPGLLLGSTSDQVVRYAKCPVLVDKAVGGNVPEPETTSDTEEMERALLSELKLD
ncbi:universal stress protein [Aeromicrobium sp. S22]|uniref:universal stress protein n=1 Tax=Aeromicrobium sp. S22 TaxID=2662029 RepID=UPI00129D6205|nr:universal stress protein [Aeromicrobium sp. S22]MRK02263.1 universal stress protein [Aeromicrobium sp. S22]